jgi:hypothetical protein
LPTMSIIGSPGRTTEPGLTRTLLTTPRSSIEGWHRHRARPTPSGRGRLFVSRRHGRNLPVEGAPLSAERRQSTKGRQRVVGSTQSVVIGSFLGGRSDLVSRFRRRPQPRHRRDRVPGKTQQKHAGESLLTDAGSRGRN